MKLVDTTFLVDLLRNKTDVVKKAKEIGKESPIFFSEISRFELVIGCYALEGDISKRISAVDSLLHSFEPLPFNKEAATESGTIAGDLNRKGKQIDPSDTMIAGTALANGISIIVTRNKTHFERIPEIMVETY